jgi:ring-1,2-phenylacetyl-CoA epoxidase subunit PaaA
MTQTAQASEQYLDMVRLLIRTQGWRELLGAELFADALKYVPTPQRKKEIASHISEELEHFELCDQLYRTLGGDLWQDVQGRLKVQPWPRIESWPDLVIFQFLNDRASRFQLLEYRDSSYAPYAKIVAGIIEEEERHTGFGESFLSEMCAGEEGRRQAQHLFDKWFPLCLKVFGRPGTPGNRYAVEAGLKHRDSGAVMRDYVQDLKPVMAQCGLRFPPREEMGVEIPPDIDLTLAAAP